MTQKIPSIEDLPLVKPDRSNRASKTILLTGSTGFVGTHAVHNLVNRGYKVRCFVRSTSDKSRLPSKVDTVVGHLLNYESLQEAVEGCWGVMHVAGITRARESREFYRINSDGTANLVKAAGEADVKRFLLCSSQAAGGPSTPEQRRKVSDPPAPLTEYGKSKLGGEEALKSGAKDMWWCIVRPSAVYGPWDRAFLSIARWIKLGIKLRLGDGNMPFALIHAADLAMAMRQAIEAETESGSIWYATDGVDHTMEELVGHVQESMSKNARWLTIPLWFAPAVAGTIEVLARMRGENPLLGRQKLSELTQPAWTCDDEPLRFATGYKPMYDLASGIAETIDWYRQKGWI